MFLTEVVGVRRDGGGDALRSAELHFKIKTGHLDHLL